MAKLYPAQIPCDAPLSEKKVLESLAYLPNAYSIFHSVNWLNLHPKAKQRVGETDLIIIHPKHGILVVEVKGGQIYADDGDWYSESFHGDVHKLSRSPALQARGNLYFIKEKLEAKRIIPSLVFDQGLMGYAVWFPDVDKTCASLPLDLDANIVLDQSSLFETDVENDISLAFLAWRKHPSAELDKQQVARICQMLAPTVNMTASLSLSLKQQEKDLIQLTAEQQQMFTMAQSNTKLLVNGGAGTGKTLLAIEDAKFQATQGRKTLLLCFNNLLAEFLVSAVQDESLITAASFHSFSQQCCMKAGLTYEPPKDSRLLSEYYNDTVPELLMQAAAITGEKFDALIVDEGQDFKPEWWLALDEILSPNAVFHCFYDTNQSIYQEGWEPPFTEPVFGPLKVNCRNTAPIGAKARELGLVKGDEQYRSVDGVSPYVLTYVSVDDMKKQVIALIQAWVTEGNVSLSDIVILSPYKRSKSGLGGEKLGKWRVYDLLPGQTVQGITFSTIHAFKGLESDAVIVADMDGSSWSMNHQMLYVAASRAKHLLATCISKDVNMK